MALGWLYFVLLLHGFIAQVVGDCAESGTCCSQYECEYHVFQELIKLKEKVTSLTEVLEGYRTLGERNSTGGTSYIRWGRTSCPKGATKVYEGYAGGSFYNHKGAAANALCLTKEPRWGRYTSTVEPSAYIYGAEYETWLYSYWNYLDEHDVPCVVCHVPRNDLLMVPGSYICPNGYNREYSGYLMAGRANHEAASEYLCMDGQPQKKSGGEKDLNGYTLHFVQARCGSLNCPPYENGRELTCAVCSF